MFSVRTLASVMTMLPSVTCLHFMTYKTIIYTEKKDTVIVTKKENYSQMTDYHWIILLKYNIFLLNEQNFFI